MMRGERAQRAVVAALGVTVERERQAKGDHTMLYCRGPAGQKFSVVITRRENDWRGILNFEARIRRALAATQPKEN